MTFEFPKCSRCGIELRLFGTKHRGLCDDCGDVLTRKQRRAWR